MFHTDRGIDYAPNAFRERPAELGITQSMNRPGKVADNAFIESLFHSTKSEVMDSCRFTENSQILAVLRSYIRFYNRSRIHSSFACVSPATYEKQLA